jgi:predicted DNA-binding transcriptional regulator AlpA
MPLELDQKTYFTAAEVVRELGISRQTLWRWRQDGIAPAGHRFRDRQILFTAEEYQALKDYANHVEPVSTFNTDQLGLFPIARRGRDGGDGGERK